MVVADVDLPRAGRRRDDTEVRSLPEARSLEELRSQARTCTRCPLYRNATQTVFGEGPAPASVMFVGEQPGDKEDLKGKPFVGPAGAVFDQALAEAGIARGEVYVTNAVKHFKFEPRGKWRLHKRPNANEVEACRWWLDREIAFVKPKVIVALGATAAQSLGGRAIAVTKLRGQKIDFRGRPGTVTVHPSYLLRIPDRASAEEERARFIDDLKAVVAMMRAA